MSRENKMKSVKRKLIGCFCFAVVASGAVLAPAALLSPNAGLNAAADDNTSGTDSASVIEVNLNDMLSNYIEYQKNTRSGVPLKQWEGINVGQRIVPYRDTLKEYEVYIINIDYDGHYKFTGDNLVNGKYVGVQFYVLSGRNVTIDFDNVKIVNGMGDFIYNDSGTAPEGFFSAYEKTFDCSKSDKINAYNYVIPFDVDGTLIVTGKLTIDTYAAGKPCTADSTVKHKYIVPLKDGSGIFVDNFTEITFTDGAEVETFAAKYPCRKTVSDNKIKKIITAKQSHTDADNDKICDDCGKSLSSSGGSSSKPSRPVTPPEPKPIINGKETSWRDVAKEIMSLEEGSEYRIELNGITEAPEEVIKAIADKKIKTTFVVGIARSFYVDGAYISDPCAADLTMDYSNDVNTSGLRGIIGTRFSIHDTNIPTDVDIIFKEEHAKKFANLFKEYDDGIPVHLFTTEISDSGKVRYEGIKNAGDYIVMISDFSDLPGDMNNDGILNAKDALAILEFNVGLENGKNPYVADINNDGIINAKDALAILKKSAGLI